jgi:signal transduction histidine kinase
MDASQLRDVAVNLLNNAIRFSPDGARIEFQARRHGDAHVQFAVRDEGVGISEADLPHIFERFFGTVDTRHHSSGSYEFKTRGAGCGLALVRKFVELHGGNVRVDSQEGEGSTFTVTLPLEPTARDAEWHGDDASDQV